MQASTDPYLPPKRNNNSQRNLRQDEKFKTHLHNTEVKENQTKLQGTNVLSVKEAIILQVPVMAPLEKFNTVKEKKLCYNCRRDDHFTSKCKSENT